MKAAFLFLLLGTLLTFTSCQKNELEGIQANNPYDIEQADFVTIDNIRAQSCEVILVDIVIKEQLIPKGLDFTHVIIENESNNRSRLIDNFNNIYIKIPCNKKVTLKLYLFNIALNQKSAPSIYTYQP